jgi:multiple sugar transport system permease protein
MAAGELEVRRHPSSRWEKFVMTTSALTDRATRPPRKERRLLAPYLFTAPAIVLYIIFTVIPVAYAIWLSTRAYRVEGGLVGRKVDVFVGFENYLAVFNDPAFTAGFGRLAIYGLISVPLTLGLALLFALLLDVPAARAKRFSRTAIFIPYAVPGIVAALMWGFMYLPSTSPFSYITRALGLGTIPFLEEDGLFGSLANIAIWGGVGFNMIIIYTSLRSIPEEIYESARLDGAGEVQIAMQIKVPLVALCSCTASPRHFNRWLPPSRTAGSPSCPFIRMPSEPTTCRRLRRRPRSSPSEPWWSPGSCSGSSIVAGWRSRNEHPGQGSAARRSAAAIRRQPAPASDHPRRAPAHADSARRGDLLPHSGDLGLHGGQ